jgi:hypothetical protein
LLRLTGDGNRLEIRRAEQVAVKQIQMTVEAMTLEQIQTELRAISGSPLRDEVDRLRRRELWRRLDALCATSSLNNEGASDADEIGEQTVVVASSSVVLDRQLITPRFVYDSAPHPVELLRDQRGVYGIGVSDLFDSEAIAWSCGIEPEPHTFERPPSDLILRPDRLLDSRTNDALLGTAVLQKIAGGFRRGPFMHTREEQLRRFIHHEALNRAALPWPPPPGDSPSGFPQWWSADKKQQARNRGIYHGLRRLSLHVVNHLIGVALEAAADADAVKAARRFAFAHRESIYRAAALSRRALQLTETFPVLALAIYAEHWQVSKYRERHTEPLSAHEEFRTYQAEATELRVRRNEAVKLVAAGARLRDVAGAMGISMALRRIKPGVAHLATEILCRHPDLLRAMPDSVPNSRIWLRVVPWAYNRVSAEFAEWAARQTPQIPGTLDRVGGILGDIADWVRAGMPDADPLSPRQAGGEFVVRPFTPSMSLKTTMRLSADWHEAVANNLDGPNSAFPDAWYPAARLGDYEILPIEEAASLYRDGTAMHHCVGTYGDRVQRGDLYIYSIHRNGERVATLALGRHHDGQGYLEQIRGPCNTDPPKPIVAAVQRWLHVQKPLPAPGVPAATSAEWRAA